MRSHEMSIESEDSLERTQQYEADSEDNEQQEQRGASSSSSSDGSNEFGPNKVTSIQAGPLLLQGNQEMFQSGATSVPRSQQAVKIALANLASAGTSGHYVPPTVVESSQQGIQSLSSLPQNHPSLSSENGNIPSEKNLSFFIGNDDQENVVPSRIGNHVEQSPPSSSMGMENQGFIFPTNEAMQNFGNSYEAINPYHLPLSNLPSEFRLESSSRIQLPQIQQQDPQIAPDKGDGGLIRRPQWTPQRQTITHDPPNATGTQEIKFQGMLDQASSGPNNFVSGADISTHVQVPNMPIQPEMGPYVSASSLPYSFEGLFRKMYSSVIEVMKAGLGTVVWWERLRLHSGSKVKMAWQGDNNLPPSPGLQLGSWFSRGQNYYNNPSTTAQSSR
ncbi:hypothetical protein L484_015096 [Morus notabilis]|uniref:Uncharacterized protein n=1 Tax=Morus notabilis TaxID=981085 RepID=W9SVF1_9ROSA|nr:hypothetical protein L484_015096 [Morus notabilis]